MADTCTVTGKVAGGVTMTAKVFTGVTQVVFDTVNNMVRVYVGSDCTDVDINAGTTITATLSSGAFAFTVS